VDDVMDGDLLSAKMFCFIVLFVFVMLGWGLAADRLGQIKMLEKENDILKMVCGKDTPDE